MASLKTLKSFEIDKSEVSLWLFRKKPRPQNEPPRFAGKWVDTHENLDAKLKEAVSNARERITETQEYALLAQNNEGSALIIDALVTNAGMVVTEAAAELPALRIKSMQEIQNTSFYVIKLVWKGTALYAVRKSEGSWQTKQMRDIIYAFYSNNRLAVDDKPSFRISPSIDFLIFDGQVIITNKAHFESILAYKQAHVDDFKELQQETDFKGLFTDLGPLVTFVGNNKIHLRRACAIREKGHYKNKGFMDRLRQDYAQYHLKLDFDAHGRIVPSEGTGADIIRALLDHRLLSPFSEHLYDVQDAAIVP